MGWIDAILNLTGLLLWIYWRALGRLPVPHAPASHLASTLRRAGASPGNRWAFFLLLCAILVLRALFYWQVGSGLNWTASLEFGPVSLVFRSDYLERMLLFSLLSFLSVLGAFYIGLFLFFAATATARAASANPWHPLLLQLLVPLHRMPPFLMPLFAWLSAALAWFLCALTLPKLGLLPPSASTADLLKHSAVLGLFSFVLWSWLAAALLIFEFLYTYIHFGEFRLLEYLHMAARRILTPIAALPLRLGKLDISPLLAAAACAALAFYGPAGIARLFEWTR